MSHPPPEKVKKQMSIMESLFSKASKTVSVTASIDNSTSSSVCANRAETEAQSLNTSDGPSTIVDAENVCDTVIPKPNTDANNCTNLCCDLSRPTAFRDYTADDLQGSV